MWVVFTRENARSFQVKSTEAKRIAKAVREAQDQWERDNPPPPPKSHQEVRLDRVRLQLDKIDLLITKAKDPRDLDRLAAASQKLSELERVLSDRPLPGSRRPPNPRRSRVGSVDAMPE